MLVLNDSLEMVIFSVSICIYIIQSHSQYIISKIFIMKVFNVNIPSNKALTNYDIWQYARELDISSLNTVIAC